MTILLSSTGPLQGSISVRSDFDFPLSSCSTLSFLLPLPHLPSRSAMLERIKAIEHEISITQVNKATNKHL